MYVEGVESSIHGFYAIPYTEYKFNDTHVKGVNSVLYLQRSLTPPRGKAI